MIGLGGGSLYSMQSVAFSTEILMKTWDEHCHPWCPLLCSAASPEITHGKPLVNALLNPKITTAANAVILPNSVAHSVSAFITLFVDFRYREGGAALHDPYNMSTVQDVSPRLYRLTPSFFEIQWCAVYSSRANMKFPLLTFWLYSLLLSSIYFCCFSDVNSLAWQMWFLVFTNPKMC